MDIREYGPNIEVPTAKSLLIEMRKGDLRLATGTAILVSEDQSSHCALITNRHNITGKNQDTHKPLHSMGGLPDNIVIYFHKEGDDVGKWVEIELPLYKSDGSPCWIEHPRLGAKADVVALNLTWGSDVAKFPYYLSTTLDQFDIAIGPAEPVSVIGFPFGLSSAKKYPIWATGFLAQELSLVTDENPTFLIDCRTRPGQSGSAVIAFRPGGYRKIEDGKASVVLSAGTVWEFLGVYAGRVRPDSDLGTVWHVSAIRELLAASETDFKLRLG